MRARRARRDQDPVLDAGPFQHGAEHVAAGHLVAGLALGRRSPSAAPASRVARRDARLDEVARRLGDRRQRPADAVEDADPAAPGPDATVSALPVSSTGSPTRSPVVSS